jgi:hypothetical protein
VSLRRDEACRQSECDSQCFGRGLHDFYLLLRYRGIAIIVAITRPRFALGAV